MVRVFLTVSSLITASMTFSLVEVVIAMLISGMEILSYGRLVIKRNVFFEIQIMETLLGRAVPRRKQFDGL